MKDKEPVYVRYVELTPLCKRVLDKYFPLKERAKKEAEGLELPIEHVKLMQPILTKKDRQELIDAGIVIFDHKMSKGNKYILHIPRLLELVRGSTTKEAEGGG